MRVWVSEPRACIFHVNSPGVNVGWPRLSLTLVPCAGLAFWWGYHPMTVGQALSGGLE